MVDKKRIKIKLSRRQLIVLTGLFALIALALIYFYFGPKPLPPLTSIKYYNKILNFRADLREAQKIPVYPEDLAVRNEIMNQLVENVTIAFKPASDTENSLYVLEEMEIIPKLLMGYERIKTNPHFNAVAVSSYENIAGTIQNPVIVLVHPKYSNETSISIGFHSIYIKGKTAKDFDLATIRFLMAALDLKIS
jgi:hypothetical protein